MFVHYHNNNEYNYLVCNCIFLCSKIPYRNNKETYMQKMI